MRSVVALAGGLALAVPAAAWANGLTTHVWITRTAAELVPEGPLGALVRDPALTDALLSGTIFPDGGYAVGDGYGELAHWEPLQLAYLEWIRAHYAPPWSDEAKRHIAFLMGLSSHGMADQVFDSLYMERARQEDAASDWANLSMDEATDVAMAAKVGPQPVPARFLPVEALLAAYADAHGYQPAQDTLQRGQSLVGLAVAVVGMLGQDPEAVASYADQFPWATAHMDDPERPGAPRFEAQVVADYWARIWARLHGALAADDLLMATVPAPGGLGHPRAAGTVEARASVIFTRRLLRRDVNPEAFGWRAADGAAVPFSVRLFYGDDSHVVHLIPEADLAPDTDYVITVQAGLTTREGAAVPAPLEVPFSTRAPAPAAPPEGCATGAAAPSGWALLLAGLVGLRARGSRRGSARSPRTPPRR
jgi:hypothetical protein